MTMALKYGLYLNLPPFWSTIRTNLGLEWVVTLIPEHATWVLTHLACFNSVNVTMSPCHELRAWCNLVVHTKCWKGTFCLHYEAKFTVKQARWVKPELKSHVPESASQLWACRSCRKKEAGKGFLLHACAQSTHAVTDMHSSENIAANGKTLQLIEQKNISLETTSRMRKVGSSRSYHLPGRLPWLLPYIFPTSCANNSASGRWIFFKF